MNISYDWLKELIDIDLAVEEAAKELTRVGLAVEGIHSHGDDFVLDIDLTSNRPDCLSHLGVARELSVSTGKQVKLSGVNAQDIPFPAALASEVVTVEEPELCNRFTARIIRGVKVGPSPDWLVGRLEAVGERSINNVADITNYVMLELGQPMHAFDLDKLAENRIVVRRAKPSEHITTLDEVDRTLEPTVLAICDAEKPIAIGGVMGGLESCITENTVNVVLEVAYFNRGNIRGTSRSLSLMTEASYRFERGVDIQNLKRASDRAADLICELAGGEKGEFYDIYPRGPETRSVESPDISASVARLTGLHVETDRCNEILASLGITRDPADSTTYTSPSWRHDIAIEEGLVEEVARHFGYENIAAELPPAYGAGEYQPNELRKLQIRRALSAQGFDEAITYSFIAVETDGLFAAIPGLDDSTGNRKYVELKDAVIEGAVRMRPTLIPGLLDAVRLNLNQSRRTLKLFEIGRAFAGSTSEDGLPQERELLSLVVTGSDLTENVALAGRDLDLYDAKGAVEAAFNVAGVSNVDFRPSEFVHLRRGQSAEILVAGMNVGTLGRLSDAIAGTHKFKQPVFVAEVDLDAVLASPVASIAYRPLSRFPGITRDVSLVVDRNTTWSEIRDGVRTMGYDLCRAVEFVDVFEGKGLNQNERSLTLRLEYRSDERTLVEDEVDAIHSAILKRLEHDMGVKPRV